MATDWNGLLANFLVRKDTTPHQIDALQRLLARVPDHESTKHLLPIEEAEERLGCMRRVQNRWKAQFSVLTGHPKELYKPLPQIIIATMMTMDLTMLVDYTKHGHMIDDALKHLFVMPCFVKIRKYRAVSSACILLLICYLIQS